MQSLLAGERGSVVKHLKCLQFRIYAAFRDAIPPEGLP
jgi:hypothetical protein